MAPRKTNKSPRRLRPGVTNHAVRGSARITKRNAAVVVDIIKTTSPPSPFPFLELPTEIQDIIYDFHLADMVAHVVVKSRGRLAIKSPLLLVCRKVHSDLHTRMTWTCPKIIVDVTDCAFQTLKAFMDRIERDAATKGPSLEFWKDKKMVIRLTLSPSWTYSETLINGRCNCMDWMYSKAFNKARLDITYEVKAIEVPSIARKFVQTFPWDRWRPFHEVTDWDEIIESELFMQHILTTLRIPATIPTVIKTALLNWFRCLLQDAGSESDKLKLLAEAYRLGYADDPVVQHMFPQLELCLICCENGRCPWVDGNENVARARVV